jgi:GH25 family lysozyme M1 (1,4-beta-N-acetylmuramidase)
MVSVADGTGGQMWVPLYDEVPVSAFSSDEFASDGTYINYIGTQYKVQRGIDVSEHQGEINWQAVRGDGVEFAVIRAGYRGYSEGSLYEDAFFRRNIADAQAAGIKVGIYFFSQAAHETEAEEEAAFLLGLLAGYTLDLPVFYDWERVTGVGKTRVDEVSGETLTDCAAAFCTIVENAGYTAGVYFYRSLGYYDYAIDRLTDYVFWAGAPGIAPDFYYQHTMWQYSFTGRVSGIETETDLNLLFLPAEADSERVPPPDDTDAAVPPEAAPPSVSG